MPMTAIGADIPFTTEDKVIIKHYRVGYSRRQLLREFPDKPWTQGCLDYLLHKIDTTGCIDFGLPLPFFLSMQPVVSILRNR